MKRALAWWGANYVNMQGRISRRRFWQLYLLLFFLKAGFAICLNITLTENPGTLLLSGLSWFHLAFILALAYLLLVYLAHFSIFMRRVNDMGVEGNILRFVIVSLCVIFMFYIFPILILGSLPGMKGQNQYGADPLG